MSEPRTIQLAFLLALAALLGACGENSTGAKDAGDTTSVADPQGNGEASRTLYVKAAGMVKKLGIT